MFHNTMFFFWIYVSFLHFFLAISLFLSLSACLTHTQDSWWTDWHFFTISYSYVTKHSFFLFPSGFGDFVPAQNVKDNVELSIALCSIYLLFGIALLAMSFNLVQEEVISNVKNMAKRLGILKDEEEEEDLD